MYNTLDLFEENSKLIFQKKNQYLFRYVASDCIKIAKIVVQLYVLTAILGKKDLTTSMSCESFNLNLTVTASVTFITGLETER